MQQLVAWHTIAFTYLGSHRYNGETNLFNLNTVILKDPLKDSHQAGVWELVCLSLLKQ